MQAITFFSERDVSLSKKLDNDQLQEVVIKVCNVRFICTEHYDNGPIHGVEASLCEQNKNYNLQIVATITESVEDTMKELNRFIYSTTSLHLVEKIHIETQFKACLQQHNLLSADKKSGTTRGNLKDYDSGPSNVF